MSVCAHPLCVFVRRCWCKYVCRRPLAELMWEPVIAFPARLTWVFRRQTATWSCRAACASAVMSESESEEENTACFYPAKLTTSVTFCSNVGGDSERII